MSWQGQFALNDTYLEVVWSESMSLKEVSDVNAWARQIMDEHGVRPVLQNWVGLRRFPMLVVPAIHHTANPDRFWHRVRMAGLIGPEQRRDAALWEDMLVNEGRPARVFTERQTAVDWLLTD